MQSLSDTEFYDQNSKSVVAIFVHRHKQQEKSV